MNDPTAVRHGQPNAEYPAGYSAWAAAHQTLEATALCAVAPAACARTASLAGWRIRDEHR